MILIIKRERQKNLSLAFITCFQERRLPQFLLMYFLSICLYVSPFLCKPKSLEGDIHDFQNVPQLLSIGTQMHDNNMCILQGFKRLWNFWKNLSWMFQLQQPMERYLILSHRRCYSLPFYFSYGSGYIMVHFMQQYSKQLEKTMENFAVGEIKILICTNIVESGLDIQNANTIIIQDVQQFGLAQLYQVLSSLLKH